MGVAGSGVYVLFFCKVEYSSCIALYQTRSLRASTTLEGTCDIEMLVVRPVKGIFGLKIPFLLLATIGFRVICEDGSECK